MFGREYSDIPKVIWKFSARHAAACRAENKNCYICISEGACTDTLYETLPGSRPVVKNCDNPAPISHRVSAIVPKLSLPYSCGSPYRRLAADPRPASPPRSPLRTQLSKLRFRCVL